MQFSSPMYCVMENGGSMTIDVVLSAPSSNTVTVEYATSDGTATAGADYDATNGTLTFAPGETSKTFAVPILPDTIVEDSEWLTLTLSEASNATISPTQGTATVTITDDDAPPPMVFLSAATYSVPENSTMPIIEVKLSAPASTTITVPFTVTNGTAEEGTDFSFPPSPLTFLPGETSQMIGMTINDMEVEPDESFFFALGQPDGAVLGTPSSATITIIDDDDPVPTVQFIAPDYSVGEADGTTMIWVYLSAPSTQTVTVNYETSDGTAVAGTNYSPAMGTLTFAPGETVQYFNVGIIDDFVVNPDQTVNLTLSTPQNAILGSPSTAILTIAEADALPAAQFDLATYTAKENAGLATIWVALSAPCTQTVTINYETSNGTATAPQNYLPASGTLTFAPFETLKSFQVDIVDDFVVQPDHTVNLNLSGPQNATLGVQR